MPDRNALRYLVLNRFDDEFGEYHRFVADVDCDLVYLTLPVGLAVLDRRHALDTVVVDSLDLRTVEPLVEALSARYGDFAGVVGISEREVLTAARLRERFGWPGWSPEFVTRFLDKPRMKELVGGAGLRVPAYRTFDGPGDAAAVAAEVGLPAVLKPRAEAASRGVVVVDDVDSLAAEMSVVDPQQYECEEYIEGHVLHADGVRRGGAFHFVSVSEYVGTCLGFAQGRPLGSVLLDPGPERDRGVAFVAACLDALELADGPFHFEFFRTASNEYVFLEIGIRPGGAEVGFIHRDLLGIDLFGESFRAALGLPVMTAAEFFSDASGGGWVLVPERGPLPSRVVSRTPMRHRIPEVYAEVLPEIGQVFTGQGGYYLIGGRFRLRGQGYQDVRRAVVGVIETYELHVTQEYPQAVRDQTEYRGQIA